MGVVLVMVLCMIVFIIKSHFCTCDTLFASYVIIDFVYSVPVLLRKHTGKQEQ